MDDTDTPRIRRRADGSIDIERYIARGADARADAAQGLARAALSKIRSLTWHSARRAQDRAG